MFSRARIRPATPARWVNTITSPISHPIPRRAAATNETIATGAGEIAAVRDAEEEVAVLAALVVRVVPAAPEVRVVRAARVVPVEQVQAVPVALGEVVDAMVSNVDPPRGTFQQPGPDGWSAELRQLNPEEIALGGSQPQAFPPVRSGLRVPAAVAGRAVEPVRAAVVVPAVEPVRAAVVVPAVDRERAAVVVPAVDWERAAVADLVRVAVPARAALLERVAVAVRGVLPARAVVAAQVVDPARAVVAAQVVDPARVAIVVVQVVASVALREAAEEGIAVPVEPLVVVRVVGAQSVHGVPVGTVLVVAVPQAGPTAVRGSPSAIPKAGRSADDHRDFLVAERRQNHAALSISYNHIQCAALAD